MNIYTFELEAITGGSFETKKVFTVKSILSIPAMDEDNAYKIVDIFITDPLISVRLLK